MILELIQSSSFGGLEQVALRDYQLLKGAGLPIKLSACGEPRLTAGADFVHKPLKNHGDLRAMRLPKAQILYAHQTSLAGSLSMATHFKHFESLILHAHLMLDHQKKDWYHHWVYSAVKVVIAIAPEHVQNLVEALPNNTPIAEVPLALADAFTRPKLCPVGEDIFVVGRLDPHKGQELVCQWAAQRPELRFRVVGEPTPGLQDWARALKAKAPANVIFEGAMPVAQLADCLSRARLLIMPSRRETLGLVALEALACGCPVYYLEGCGSQRLQEFGAIPVPAGEMVEALRSIPEWSQATRQHTSRRVIAHFSSENRLSSLRPYFLS